MRATLAKPIDLGDLDRDDVLRLNQRVAYGHRPHLELVAEIARRVWLVPVLELLRFVNEGRRGGDRIVHIIAAGRDCSGVNEWFEDRTRLASRVGRAVELALRVIASADHRHNLAGLRVHRHHRRLQALRAFLALREQLVQPRSYFSRPPDKPRAAVPNLLSNRCAATAGCRRVRIRHTGFRPVASGSQ